MMGNYVFWVVVGVICALVINELFAPTCIMWPRGPCTPPPSNPVLDTYRLVRHVPTHP